MRNFIEDYLSNPTLAIASASEASDHLGWADGIDENLIYAQISSPEFRLYEEMIFCTSADDLHTAESIRPFA